MGYEQVEIDDICDELENFENGYRVDKDFQDGVYSVVTSDRDMKLALSGMPITFLPFDFDKGMDKVSCFAQGSDNITSGYIITIISIEFESEKNALAYMDISNKDANELQDAFAEYSFSYDKGNKNGTEYVVCAVTDDQNDMVCHFGVYQCEKFVYAMVTVDFNTTKGIREAERNCEKLDIVSPSEA